MAKRPQVQDLQFSTAVKPTARMVDIYTRQPAQSKKQSDLEGFVNAIAPVVNQKIQEEQKQKEKLATATRQGIVDKQAYEAKKAVRDLAQIGAQEFEDNQDEYLSMSTEEVSSHRQGNYDRYYQELKQKGVTDTVINLIQKDMEAVEYEFFTKAFNPAKREKDENTALATLGSNLEALLDRPQENGLGQAEMAIDAFMELYPTINKGKISDYVFDLEERYATSLDDKGFTKGKSFLSDWLVKEKRTNTERNITGWKTIENADVRRQVAKTKAIDDSVEATTKTLSDAIVGTMVNELTVNEDTYYNNPQAIEEYATQFLALRGEEIKEQYGEAVYKEFMKKATTDFRQKRIDKFDAKFVTRRNDENLSRIMTGAISFVHDTETPIMDRVTNFNKYAETVVTESGMSKDDFAEQLVEQQLALTPEYGIETPAMAWLSANGYTTDERFSKSMVEISNKAKTFNNKFLVQSSLVEGFTKFNQTGNTAFIPTQVVNSDGNIINISDSRRDAGYELANPTLSLEQKIDNYYSKVGTVPVQARVSIKNGVRYFSPTQQVDEESLLIANQTFDNIKMLESKGIEVSTDLVSQEVQDRMTIVDYWMNDAEPKLAFKEALQISRNADLTTTVPKASLTKSVTTAMSEGGTIGVLDVDESLTIGKAISQVSKDAEILIQSGVPEETAIDTAVASYKSNNVGHKDSFGFEVFVHHRGQDAASRRDASSSFNEFAKAVAQLPSTQKIAKGLLGDGEYGIRIVEDPSDYNMVLLQFVDKGGVTYSMLPPVSRFQVVNDRELLKRYKAQLLNEQNSLTPEDVDID